MIFSSDQIPQTQDAGNVYLYEIYALMYQRRVFISRIRSTNSLQFNCRFWFHFTVENTQKNQRVIFNVVNMSKSRTLFADGLTPVVKSTTRPR